MAEALIRKAIEDSIGVRLRNHYLTMMLSKIVVESAGTYTSVSPDCLGSPAHTHSVACMIARGINIALHKSRPISALNLNTYDLIVCMSDAEVEFVAKLRPRGAIILANAANGGVPNPWEKGLEAYQQCAKALEKVAHDIVETYLT